MDSSLNKAFMIEDGEATIPQDNEMVIPQGGEVAASQDDETTLSWEKVTGLSGNMLKSLKQSQEIASKITSNLSFIAGAVKPSLLFEGIRPPVALLDSMKPPLLFEGIRPQVAFLDAVNLSTVFQSVIKPSSLLEGIQPIIGLIDVYSPLLSLTTTVADAFASFSSSLVGIGRALDWIGGTTSSIGNIQAWMPFNFKHLEERLRLRILVAFERAGLCLAPSMSEELMDQIAYYEGRGDLRPVILLVWRHYSEHDYARLRRAVAGWNNNSEFAARWHFFDAALQTHVLKIYEASVSTLIPQIEGIASSFVYNNVINIGPGNSVPRLGKTDKVILYMLDIAGDVPNLDADVSGFKGWVMVKSIIQYVQNVLCRFMQFGQDFENIRKSRRISRHGALHGMQLAHTTAMNSLRLFLLLDSIHYILESYKSNGTVIW